MTAYELALETIQNDSVYDPDYRMTVEEAQNLLDDWRRDREDDELDDITAEDLSTEYNELQDSFAHEEE